MGYVPQGACLTDINGEGSVRDCHYINSLPALGGGPDLF